MKQNILRSLVCNQTMLEDLTQFATLSAIPAVDKVEQIPLPTMNTPCIIIIVRSAIHSQCIR